MKDKKVRDSQVLPTAQVNQPNAESAEKTSRDKLTGKGRQDEIHAGQNVKDTMPGVSRRKFMSGATTLAVLGSTGVLELLAPTTAEAIERGPFVATPQTRVNQFVTVRNNATTEDANIEINQFPHRDNGDDELYPNRLGSFSKTLQHNDLGEVDQPSYNALLHAIDTGSPARITAGQFSILTVTAPAGQPLGNAALTVSAAATVDGIPVTQSADVGLNVQAATTHRCWVISNTMGNFLRI